MKETNKRPTRRVPRYTEHQNLTGNTYNTNENANHLTTRKRLVERERNPEKSYKQDWKPDRIDKESDDNKE